MSKNKDIWGRLGVYLCCGKEWFIWFSQGNVASFVIVGEQLQLPDNLATLLIKLSGIITKDFFFKKEYRQVD